MMVCSTALINLARKMQERWGIPYLRRLVLRHLRYVRRAAPASPRLLVERGADAGLIDRTEALIAEEEARAWARIEPYRRR